MDFIIYIVMSIAVIYLIRLLWNQTRGNPNWKYISLIINLQHEKVRNGETGPFIVVFPRKYKDILYQDYSIMKSDMTLKERILQLSLIKDAIIDHTGLYDEITLLGSIR